MYSNTIFISYSNKDFVWEQMLENHLGILKEEERLIPWSDNKIEPGDKWQKVINEKLKHSKVAILLISQNFLESDFIIKKEWPILKERWQNNQLKLIPIVINSCSWQKRLPILKNIQRIPRVPRGADHLGELDEQEQKKEFTKIANMCEKLANEVFHTKPVLQPIQFDQSSYATLVLNFQNRYIQKYQLELIFTQSGSNNDNMLERFLVEIDLKKLADIEPIDSHLYNKLLTQMIFTTPGQRDKIQKIWDIAIGLNVALVVQVCIPNTAKELHLVRWELLMSEQEDSPLYQGQTYFFRYLTGSGRNWRQGELRSKSDDCIRSAIVTTPEIITKMHAQQVDQDKEVELYASALDEDLFTTSHFKSISYGKFKSEIDNQCDICILIAQPFETDEDLTVNHTRTGIKMKNEYRDLVTAKELSDGLRAMYRPPKLIVLIPPLCTDQKHSMDTGKFLLKFAATLSKAGIPGILTLQEPIQPQNWKTFFSCFLKALFTNNRVTDGRMDIAMNKARNALTDTPEKWAPVLMTRMRTARIWYIPDFISDNQPDATWNDLVDKIKDKTGITPIIGSRITRGICKPAREIAMKWADNYHYPMAPHERISLQKVAQYIHTERNPFRLCKELEKELIKYLETHFGEKIETFPERVTASWLSDAVARRILQEDKSDPHNILASFDLPLYISMNSNRHLAIAFQEQTPPTTPHEIVFENSYNRHQSAETKVKQVTAPLIYYIYGRNDDIPSILITEDDYLQFLIEATEKKRELPSIIQNALTHSSLLFLGLRLSDLEFRVFLRFLNSFMGSKARSNIPHVAVQIEPDDDFISDPKRTRNFIEGYIKKEIGACVSVFWGSASDFLKELDRRLQGGD